MIRRPEEKDLDILLMMSFLHFQEERGHLTGDSWDYRAVLGRMQNLISWAGNLDGFVAEEDGEVVGMIHGEYGVSCVDKRTPIFTELQWYVFPKVRGKGIGYALLHELEESVRASGRAQVMWIGAGIPIGGVERVIKRYTKEGFVPFQIMCAKPISPRYGGGEKK